MSDVVCDVLCRIVQEYGTKICEEPSRVRGLLKDHCGERKKEIHALIVALEGHVPSTLQSASNSLPISVQIAQSARKLEEETGLTETIALWAVQTWAVALRLTNREEVEESPLYQKTLVSPVQEVKQDSPTVVSLPTPPPQDALQESPSTNALRQESTTPPPQPRPDTTSSQTDQQSTPRRVFGVKFWLLLVGAIVISFIAIGIFTTMVSP